MEVLQIIQGREAVPVRAIPFLTGWTGWKTMTPIDIAKALAGTDDQGDFAGLTAYKLRADGSIKKTLQQEWLMVAKDLKGIRATTLKDAQTSHDAWHHAWSKQAIPILPAGVFVWRDEFTEQYASSYFDLPRIDSETGGYSTKKQPELEFDIEVWPPWDSLVLEGFAPAKAPAQAQQSHQETPAPHPTPAAPPEAVLLPPQPEPAPPLPLSQAVSVVAESAPDFDNCLPTPQVATLFDGLPFSADRWRKNLSSNKWLQPAKRSAGEQGGASAMWCPLALAQLVHARATGVKEKATTLKKLNSLFNRNDLLAPHRDAWREFFQLMDND